MLPEALQIQADSPACAPLRDQFAAFRDAFAQGGEETATATWGGGERKEKGSRRCAFPHL